MDLAYLVRRAARAYPDAPAVSNSSHTATLSAVMARAERFANSLDALGIERGARVGVLSENRIEYPEVDLGIVLAGRVRVALNSRLHLDDFRFALADCGAAVLVHSAQFAEVAHSLSTELGLVAISLDDIEFDELSYSTLVETAKPGPVPRLVHEEDAAWISYTSGTTGRPKGVVLSHRALREVTFNLLLELGPHAPGERMVLAQPLSHGAGYFVLPQLVAGGGVHIMSTFDPHEVIWAGGQPDITAFKAVPAMFPSLLDAMDEAGVGATYQTIIYGAAPMPAPVLERARDRAGDVFVQVYGQSEAPITLSTLTKGDHERAGEHRSSVGRPWRSVALEVRDPEGHPVPTGTEGEVTIRGSHHMSGYLNLPDATAEVVRDGWIWTKDIGRMDENGYLYLLGRRDEIINSGGFNISPREVERVLQEHPDVEECVVVGLPDDRWGEAVNALVRVRPGRALSSAEVLEFARPLLSFRTPKRVLFSDQIPRNPYGKVDRKRVLDVFEADARSGELVQEGTEA